MKNMIKEKDMNNWCKNCKKMTETSYYGTEELRCVECGEVK